jgi:hypothetical protein
MEQDEGKRKLKEGVNISGKGRDARGTTSQMALSFEYMVCL